MTFQYHNVYLNETGTVTGPYEAKGPFGKLFDKSYSDLYFGMKTWEQAESKSIGEAIDIVLGKVGKTKMDVDIHFSGDLLNQLASSGYAAAGVGIPYFGIYNACATNVEGLILASNMIEAKQVKNAICTVSSHNNAAEKQFRYPVEYGGPKPKTNTFTCTGGVAAYLSTKEKGIRIESGTIGVVQDMGIKDAYHMGAVMAPAAAKTIMQHMKDTKREPGYYDLILTGDLGVYGKKILLDFMQTEYGIELKNCEDSGAILYDREKQPVYAGASGPACSPLVTYSYVLNKMKKKEMTRVLIVATGALHSPSMINQKMTIPSIAHAISLEVIE